jgi:hypothetical protein
MLKSIRVFFVEEPVFEQELREVIVDSAFAIVSVKVVLTEYCV